MSLGTVNTLRFEASSALSNCVDEAKQYIQQQPVVGADKTSFNQGNIDGCNPKQRQAWLWVAVTPLVTFFEIALSRCTQAAQNLLGEDFIGILNSDRHGAYNWVDLERRRDVLEYMTQAIAAARSGQSAPCLLPEVSTSCSDYDLSTAA